MVKNDTALIIRGGVLCAAFSFMALFIPILGAMLNYFSLLPLFYVGICLGIRGYLLAAIMPLIGSFMLLGLTGICVFGLTTFIPSIVILHWHFFKKKGVYAFSSTDILHLLSSRFLGIVVLGFCYLHLTNSHLLELLAKKIEVISNLAKISPSTDSLISILPGIFSFLWLLMVWLNFQIAYSIALKLKKSIRKPNIKQNIFLPAVWDIALVASLWLMIANQLFINMPILDVLTRTTLCICAFPLLIDGIEIAQLMARSYKLPRYAATIFIVVTFLLVWPMVFVVVLGLVDSLYGLKKKYLMESK